MSDMNEGRIKLTPELKTQRINEFATHPGDTGSPEVQVALLTDRIKNLTEHVKEHQHDYHTKRGLLIMVGKRRRLLDYLKQKDLGRYQTLIKRLSLRK